MDVEEERVRLFTDDSSKVAKEVLALMFARKLSPFKTVSKSGFVSYATSIP